MPKHSLHIFNSGFQNVLVMPIITAILVYPLLAFPKGLEFFIFLTAIRPADFKMCWPCLNIHCDFGIFSVSISKWFIIVYNCYKTNDLNIHWNFGNFSAFPKGLECFLSLTVIRHVDFKICWSCLNIHCNFGIFSAFTKDLEFLYL